MYLVSFPAPKVFLTFFQHDLFLFPNALNTFWKIDFFSFFAFGSVFGGLSLSKAAAEAGIKTYHGTAKRLMENEHYLGDSFYPAIIDEDTYRKAQEERKRRATALGRNNKKTQKRQIQIPTFFHVGEVTAFYNDPIKQAEYLYNLIESEMK